MELDSYKRKHSSRQEGIKHSPIVKQVLHKYSKREFLLPALAILSLLIACFIVSPKKYFWNDELYSYYFTSDPSFSGMLAAFHDKINNTPILYFLLGWFWDKAFGSSELSLRLFSSIGIGVALIVTWATIRRTFTFATTSIGVLAVFCTSQIILLQNAEARMYGLFLAFCALGLFFYERSYTSRALSSRMLVLQTLVHTGIVHTHLFGGFYSGAILMSYILTDWYFKRFRPRLYLSVILSWLTILLYLPSFFVQADAGKPRTWIPEPVRADLLDLLNIFTPSFFQPGLLVFLMILAALVGYYLTTINGSTGRTARDTRDLGAEVALLIFATLFILVPVFVWLLSRTIKPVFYDRYMIPSALGWAVLLTYLSSLIMVEPKQMWLSGTFVVKKFLGNRLALIVIFAALLFYPIYDARRIPKQTPRDIFATDGYDDLPIAIAFSHAFLQAQHYATEPEKYFFILDWEAAIKENSGLFSPQEYKHLEALRRNYPERFRNTILTSEEFLSRYERFLIADYPDYTRNCPVEPKGMATARAWIDLHCPQWLETRLLHNEKYKVTYLNNSYWYTMLLVEKNP